MTDTTLGLTVTRSPTIGLTLPRRRDDLRAARGILTGAVLGVIALLCAVAAAVLIVRLVERLA